MSKKGTRRISPALSRLAQRGLAVQEEEIRTYAPSELDLLITESMLAGCLTFQEIADDLKIAPQTVSGRLKDPVTCAFISRRVHQLISFRLGLIDAAMMRRALAGDVRAAEVMYKRYGKDVKYNVNLNLGGQQLDHLSDKALDALLARHLQKPTLPAPEPQNDA